MKLKYILIAIVSLGLLGMLWIPAPTAVVAADNLAANGDLELGNTNGWEISNAAIDSATVYSGNYSLKLTATSAYSSAANKTIPVRKNATVTVSFYYRYASDPGNKLYHVYTYQGADTNVGPYSNADKSFAKPTGCNSISTWQQVSYTFNSGNYTAVTLKFCPGGNGGTTCYIDNLVVTSEGGDQTEVAPYLTSFGTKMGRPKDAASNVIVQGGFESTDGAAWNTTAFLSGGVQVVEDPTAPEGSHSLYFDGSDVQTADWHGFIVDVEPYTQYTFSAWVKSPRLSVDNNATASFGVADSKNYKFLVYEPYQGNGHGAATLSTETMQLMATAPDDAWHLRSVTFYSGSYTQVTIALYGAESQLYLDDIALFKSANGVEYISPLRTEMLTAGNNSGNKYCADADSLIEGIYMTTNDAQLSWSKNPAWRNGFLSFAQVDGAHGTVLQYAASAHTERQLHYIDWIDVTPNTSYTLTLDVKRQTAGGGRIALLDDDYDTPKEFYTIPFSQTDSDWVTYSITFNSGAYSRIGFAIVDGGGVALIDEVRLFETDKGIADELAELVEPSLKPVLEGTSTMEMTGDNLGVAFLFHQEGNRIYMDNRYQVDFSSATVNPYGDERAYTLLRMGALMTNQAAIGGDDNAMVLENVNNDTVANVSVRYLWSVSDDGCQYAVRVVNVPVTHSDTLIYARPYYVFEKDGEEIVVYGDIVYRSYNEQ